MLRLSGCMVLEVTARQCSGHTRKLRLVEVVVEGPNI